MRVRRWQWWTGGVLLTLIALIGALYAGANSDGGRRAIEAVVARLSHGRVVLSGISGHFPDDLNLARLDVSDKQGLWLTVQDASLRWAPIELLHRRALIYRLHVGRILLARKPVSDSNEPSDHWLARHLLTRVELRQGEIPELELAQPFVGVTAALALRGSARLASWSDLTLDLNVNRLDARGSYRVSGRFDRDSLRADVNLQEPAGGPLAAFIFLPNLGALSLQATLAGPRSAEQVALQLGAGTLTAQASGSLDLTARTADMRVTLTSGRMQPRAEIGWGSAALQGEWHGAWNAPQTRAHVLISDVLAYGMGARGLDADVDGGAGALNLRGRVTEFRIPGPKPALFAAAPVDVSAQMRLDQRTLPVSFKIGNGARAQVTGVFTPREPLGVTLDATLPTLAALSDLAGIDLRGAGQAHGSWARHGDTHDFSVDGRMALSGGLAPLPALIGRSGRVSFAAALTGSQFVIQRAEVDGVALKAVASGSERDGRLALDWKLAVSDLGALAAALKGNLSAQGRWSGAAGEYGATATARANVGAQSFAPSPIDMDLNLQGWPSRPTGRVRARGTLAGAPLELAAAIVQQGSRYSATIERAEWKSAHAEGAVSFAVGDRAPQGRVQWRVAQLQDLQALLGQPLRGRTSGSLIVEQVRARTRTRVDATADALALGDERIGHLAVTGELRERSERTAMTLQASASGIEAPSVQGEATLSAEGALASPLLKLDAKLRVNKLDASVSATGSLALPEARLHLTALQADYQGQRARLLSPVQIGWGQGLSIDQLRIGLEMVARAPSASAPVGTSLIEVSPAQGEFDISADLSGTRAQPQGSLRISASKLRMSAGPGRGIPPADLLATAQFKDGGAAVELRIGAGQRIQFHASGQLPLAPNAPVDLRAEGSVDLAVTDAFLQVSGRQAQGQVAVNASVAGTLQAPQITGTVKLTHGEVRDFTQGVRLTDIAAELDGSGATLRLTSFSARAGSGSISATGSLGVLQRGMPLELSVTARNAEAVSSNLLTAKLDLNLSVKGLARERLEVTGHMQLDRADITVPSAFPPDIDALQVRWPGRPPPLPPPSPPTVYAFDVTVDAPRFIFVHGRGLDAEMGGTLHIGGTSLDPQITGGFDMRRGTIDVAGASLTFSSGKVSFTGTGIKNKIDPTLDFTAQTTSGGYTATLTISGYADAPKIGLTAVPELPQDEVLARLIFSQGVTQLSALQAAQIGAALASMSGLGGNSLDPLASVQKKLRLDRLSISGGTGGTGPEANTGASVTAGRYVSNRVYVGAKQSTTGNTQAQVQIDLSKHLKFQTTLATGTTTVQGATVDNDPGSSVGLAYQIDY